MFLFLICIEQHNSYQDLDYCEKMYIMIGALDLINLDINPIH